MMFFASLKMMLLHFVPRVMRCLPQCAVRHTSFAKRTSLGVAVIICRRQTSFKKRTFVLVDKSAFFVGGDGGIRTHDPYVANVMLSQLSYTPMLLKLYHILSICQVLFEKINRQSLSAC